MSASDAIFASGKVRSFTAAHLREIAFPLGGIGTGTVSLGGRGQLRDWELFNRPSKGFTLPYSFPALWVQEEGKAAWSGVLASQIQPPYSGASGVVAPDPPGLPHLQGAEFAGAYPFARINFQDERLPVEIALTAFNPLIPLNPEDSGIPVAILRYRVRNTSLRPVRATVALSLNNPIGTDGKGTFGSNHKAFGQNLNEFVEGPYPGLHLISTRHQPTSPLYGNMALLTDWGECSYRTNFDRPGTVWGWDTLLEYWDDFAEDGRLQDTVPAKPTESEKTGCYCALALHAELDPGEHVEMPFYLAWYFPNRAGWSTADWSKEGEWVGNHYATRFGNAWEAAEYAAAHLEELEGESARYVRSVLDSTLPPPVLDAALANVSTLRTETCFCTKDGNFFGFEGCGDNAGCCQGSCTHVWNYEQTTAFLFPSLSRSMRNTEFLNCTTERGLMSFRTSLPLGSPLWEFAAADGQMGCLMKLYRDWQLCGDDEWLRQLWPAAKRALAFAWIEGGWDADQDGLMEGIQHNTWDIEWHGPHPQTGFWYLGALRAMEEMARYLGDEEAAESYRKLFESGSRAWDEKLFNGEFYIQEVQSQVGRPVAEGVRLTMGAEITADPLYQMGPGCEVDQLLGQQFAHLVGLGYLADPGNVRKALTSIHRYNYRKHMGDHVNVARTYALNDEGVTLICTWPRGGRPQTPLPYWSEGWTGVEYIAAAGMFYEGMIEEGVEIVATARDRYDGERTNPWDEAECGHHYARGMASWALLLALGGYHYSAQAGRMSFAPQVNGDDFRCFWSTASGWGTYAQRLESGGYEVCVTVEYGELYLGELALAVPEGGKGEKLQVTVAGRGVAAEASKGEGRVTVRLREGPLRIGKGQSLRVSAG